MMTETFAKSSMPCSSSVGHTVKTYREGQQLLDDPELSDVACLIVDQKMPEMTGLALLRELNHTGRTIPSLLITGLPDAQIAAKRANWAPSMCSSSRSIGRNC